MRDITEGINFIILKSIRKAISNNSEKTFLTLSRFVRKVLYLSLDQKNDYDFKSYIIFPSLYYSTSYSIAKKNADYQEILKICTKEAADTLKYLILFYNTFNKKSEEENFEATNQYYYLTYIGVSQLLYYITNNGDLDKFSICIKEFGSLVNNHDTNDFYYRIQLNRIDNNKEQVKAIKEEHLKKNKHIIYSRHAFSGIKYWIYFLYSEKIIDEQKADYFLSKLFIANLGSEDLLTDIIFFQKSDHYYFNWGDWDYIDRPDGEVYHPPVPHNWLTLGFVADLLRNNYFSINIDYLDYQDIKDAQYLVDFLKPHCEYFENNFEDWKLILKVSSLDELSDRINNILSQLIRLKRTIVANEEREIAKTNLSQERINNFKIRLGQKWREKARVHNLFEKLGTIQTINNEDKIEGLYEHIFCQNTKSMFIDNIGSDLIYGIYDLGAEIAKYEDNSFFSKLTDNKKDIRAIENLITFLDEELKNLKDKGYKPTLIFISNEYSYGGSVLLSNLKYKSKTQDDYWFNTSQIFGYYDNVPLYATYNSLISDRIIISDFKNAFTMRLRYNDTWFENTLYINVRDLNDKEALKRLNKDPNIWKKNSDNLIIDNDDALIRIKNSLIIELKIEVEFEINNIEAYSSGFIKLK